MSPAGASANEIEPLLDEAETMHHESLTIHQGLGHRRQAILMVRDVSEERDRERRLTAAIDPVLVRRTKHAINRSLEARGMLGALEEALTIDLLIEGEGSPDKLRFMEIARRVFRSYGFSPIDTPALEYLEILSGKGLGHDR